jgi:hypothetical protein
MDSFSVSCGTYSTLSIERNRLVPAEDGNRIKVPKRCVLNRKDSTVDNMQDYNSNGFISLKMSWKWNVHLLIKLYVESAM